MIMSIHRWSQAVPLVIWIPSYGYVPMIPFIACLSLATTYLIAHLQTIYE